MPWHKFHADLASIRKLLDFILDEADCRLFESYSRYDEALRELATVAEVESAFELGIDKYGKGVAQQFSLWSPKVMPQPGISRIELTLKGYSHRFVIEGCGLFWLHLGGDYNGAITESSLGYWSESSARQKCRGKPAADSVDWSTHRRLANKLRYRVSKYSDAR